MKGAVLAARGASTVAGSHATATSQMMPSSSPSSPRLHPLSSPLPRTCPLVRAPFSAKAKELSIFSVSTAAVAQESDGSSFFGGVDESALDAASSNAAVACRLVALVPSSGPNSPVAKGQASWLDVMRHEAVKIRWSDPRLEMKVVEVPEEGGGGGEEAFDAAVAGADAVVAVAFGSSSSSSSSRAAALSLLSRPSAASVRTLVPLGCEGGDRELLELARVNGVAVSSSLTTTKNKDAADASAPSSSSSSRRPLLARLPAFLSPWRRAFDSLDAALSFWSRTHSDDALTALLVVADATGKVRNPPLAALDSLKGQGLGTLLCMLRNCRGEVLNCVTDEDCKAALDCLTAAPPGDQVAAYRCIVSHESQKFEDFSLCVLTKNRCLGVSAEPPRFPQPRPQARWRGQEMTHELAEALFIGWREKRRRGGMEGGGEEKSGGEGNENENESSRNNFFDDADDETLEPWSWRVCAGQNPAYDQFNCQYQIFYRGKGKGVMWYVPLFNVETLGGGSGEGSGGSEKGSEGGGGGGSGVGVEKKEKKRERVWRKRKYRVKRAEVPGTFWFSVLDNGVVSKEFWTIVSVPDDLGYALFSYNGAASAAGQAYSGSVLCTRDGDWPAEEKHKLELERALKEAGVRTWELFRVNNDDCKGAPLEVDE